MYPVLHGYVHRVFRILLALTIYKDQGTLSLAFSAFYSLLRRSMATAGPSLRSNETVACYEIISRVDSWSLSPAMSLTGDKAVLYRAMQTILMHPWRFPTLRTINFYYDPSQVRSSRSPGFRDVVSSWGAQEGQTVCRVIDVNVKVKNIDAIGDGKEYFWFSMKWELADIIPTRVATIF